MSTKPLENENPVVYDVRRVPQRAGRVGGDGMAAAVSSHDDGDDGRDAIDELEVFELIRNINDPEHPLTLEQLNVAQLEHIRVDDAGSYVQIRFTPTIPHCFSEEHQLLTSRGFMFLKDVKAYRGDDLRFAAYDEATQQLVYERAQTLVVNEAKAQQMIEFTSATESARWNSGSDGAAGVSLVVTDGHDMYVRRLRARNSAARFRKTKAKALVGTRDAVSFLCVAPNGVRGSQGVVTATPGGLPAAVWSMGLVEVRRFLRELQHSDQNEIHAASAVLRDDIERLCLHAGYSTDFFATEDGRGWTVRFAEAASAVASPTLVPAVDRVSTVPYGGKTWCVSVPSGLLMARRARVDEHGIVVQASRPTIVGNCSMATLIGLCIRVRLLRSLPERFKVDIYIQEGTHQSEVAVNKQLNDKERVAAAMENSTLIDVVNQCLAGCAK